MTTLAVWDSRLTSKDLTPVGRRRKKVSEAVQCICLLPYLFLRFSGKKGGGITGRKERGEKRTLELLQDSFHGTGATATAHADVELVLVVGHGVSGRCMLRELEREREREREEVGSVVCG